MVGSSGDGRDRTGTCSGADANGRTVPHMACRLEKPIFDRFPHTGRGVGLLTRGEVERTMGIEPAFSAWEMPRRPVVAPHQSEVSDCPVTACNRCSGTFGARRGRCSIQRLGSCRTRDSASTSGLPVWASKQPFKCGRRASAPLGRSRLHLVRAHRDRPGHRDRRRVIVCNVWKTPTYNLIVAWDPSAMPADWQRYFTINWIQLAVTWAAFALFILALSFL